MSEARFNFKTGAVTLWTALTLNPLYLITSLLRATIFPSFPTTILFSGTSAFVDRIGTTSLLLLKTRVTDLHQFFVTVGQVYPFFFWRPDAVSSTLSERWAPNQNIGPSRRMRHMVQAKTNQTLRGIFPLRMTILCSKIVEKNKTSSTRPPSLDTSNILYVLLRGSGNDGSGGHHTCSQTRIS